jgi:hypothetical protein
MKFFNLFGGILAFCSLCIVSCEKVNSETGSGVEFYLLESFETMEQSCGIEAESVVLADKPLVYYSDILSYHSGDYYFKITEEARASIDSLEHSVSGLAFAVTAEGELVYTGYFWPSYSSASCDWLIIDPIIPATMNKIWLKLGYPGLREGAVIPDERNNEKILTILKRDGKLID